jgi:uncharacterized membrane protein YcaP (DUF421 family)
LVHERPESTTLTKASFNALHEEDVEDIQDILALDAGFVEMFTRGTVIYWALFLLLRLAGRRDVGSMGVADFLVLVLVADAAGNAMAGESTSVGDGVIVVATIVGWSVCVDRLGYHSPLLRKWLEPRRVLLVKNGRIVARGMRQEHVTRTELMAQLRLLGIGRLDEVQRAYIESDGQVSVIRMSERTDGETSTLEE